MIRRTGQLSSRGNTGGMSMVARQKADQRKKDQGGIAGVLVNDGFRLKTSLPPTTRKSRVQHFQDLVHR